jgi:hypothetical protein
MKYRLPLFGKEEGECNRDGSSLRYYQRDYVLTAPERIKRPLSFDDGYFFGYHWFDVDPFAGN